VAQVRHADEFDAAQQLSVSDMRSPIRRHWL
jgi:hypothetical protein